MTSLHNKSIIITGGSSGIGAATVKICLAHGARVAILDVNDADAEKLMATVGDDSRCGYWHCDISEREQVDGAFVDALSWLGGMDCLVNLGAVITYHPAEDFTDREWDRIFAVNTRGTMLTNQVAFRHLRQAGGSIINAGSMSGIRPHPGNAAYSATKGAVMAWTRSVAAEWGKYGIRVNAVAPVAQTPMAEIAPEGFTPEQHREFKIALAQQIPLGRIGDPETDIAPVIAFLASDASRYITGQVLAVDGGTLMLGS